MVENIPNLVKEYKPTDSRIEQILNTIDSKKFKSRFITIKLLKIKEKEKILKAVKNAILLMKNTNLHDGRFLTRNHGCEKKVTQHLSSDESKEMLTVN